jgi:hypothetical protein
LIEFAPNKTEKTNKISCSRGQPVEILCEHRIYPALKGLGLGSGHCGTLITLIHYQYLFQFIHFSNLDHFMIELIATDKARNPTKFSAASGFSWKAWRKTL